MTSPDPPEESTPTERSSRPSSRTYPYADNRAGPSGRMRRKRRVRRRSKTLFEENDISGSMQMLLFLLVVAIGTLLCQLRLDSSHFNLTESRVALLMDEDISTVLEQQVATPLSRLGLTLLSAWRETAGQTTHAIRQWSMLVGLLGLGALYLAAREIVRRRAALWASIIVVLSPAWFVHGRSVLALHVITLGTALTVGALYRYLRRPSRLTGSAFGVAISLAVILHPVAILLYPMCLAATWRCGGRIRLVAGIGALGLALTAPLWVTDLGTYLAQPSAELLPGLPDENTLNPLTWVPGVPFNHMEDYSVIGTIVGWLLAVVLLSLAVIGARLGEPESLLTARSESGPLSRQFLPPMLAVWAVVSLAMWVGGHASHALGLVALAPTAPLIGAGIERAVRWRAERNLQKGESGYRQLESRLTIRRLIGATAIAVFSVPSIARYMNDLGTWTEGQPRAQAAFLAGRIRDRDVVMSVAAHRELLGYALREMTAPHVTQIERRDPPTTEQVDSLLTSVRLGRRLWLSMAPDAFDPSLLDTISRQCRFHPVLSDTLLGVFCFAAPADSLPFKRPGE